MAKYRHRIFEMYDFCDEAIVAMTPRSADAAAEVAEAESLTLKHLTVAHLANVSLIQFSDTQEFDAETLSDLREDFVQLAEKLERNSRVLLDFTGVESFSSSSIEALALFSQKLRTKGSRIALCCLGPTAREAFFSTPSP